MMEQPTREQLERIWKWCGMVENEPTIYEGKTYRSYTMPDGRWQALYPSLDLNNLFRYAIPVLKKEYRNWKSILLDWLNNLTGDYEKDTLALFQAINEVLDS